MGPARGRRPAPTVTVDLESRTVRAGEGADAIEDSFDIDDYTRWRLLEGLDDIGITLATRTTSRRTRRSSELEAGTIRVCNRARTMGDTRSLHARLAVSGDF